MSYAFIGKFSFAQAAAVIQVDMTSGQLKVGPALADDSDRINAYGTNSVFSLQCANGKFVAYSGTGYIANKDATDPINLFTFETSGPHTLLVDLGVGAGGSTKYYLVNNNGVLERVATSSSPPVSAKFSKSIVTIGLAQILQGAPLGNTPDFRWVDFSGVDFSNAPILDFTTANFNDANFSKCKFSPMTGFDGSTALRVNFSEATLVGCSIANCHFQHANFSGAHCQQVQANDSDFTKAVLIKANFNTAVNLQNTIFKKAHAHNADFRNIGSIIHTDFTDAHLCGARFTGSFVTGKLILNGANLTGAALNNPTKQTIFPGFIIADEKTNFTRCKLQKIDFSGYDLSGFIFTRANLSGCNLDKAILIGTELSYAVLDGATLTGTVKLYGANLANASLKGADLTNAQLGALSLLFGIGIGNSDYTPLLNALQNDDPTTVQRIFKSNGQTIAGTISIIASKFSDKSWTVDATIPSPTTFIVENEKIGGVLTLNIYKPTTPAILANAFMVNTILASANMIGVNASGASIYAIAGKHANFNSTLLQGAQFDNSNLSNADFSSANLAGASFDYAILAGAVFQNSQLITNATGARVSFNGANLQGANFDGATLDGAVFNNAAFGIAQKASPTLAEGVWLFSIPENQAGLIKPELQSASANGGHQFNLPIAQLPDLQVPGVVTKPIRQGFKAAGITLTSDALLVIMNESIFWTVSDGVQKFVIFKSYNTAQLRPALGVASGSSYTSKPDFTFPLSLEADLKNGKLSPDIISAFKTNGHIVSPQATMSAKQHPTEWQVIDGAPSYQLYSVWLNFGEGTAALTVRPAISNLISIFANYSIAISRRATIGGTSSSSWMLDNDSSNPFNPVKNYIIYRLSPNPKTKGIDVYGTEIRVLRFKSPTESEYFNIPVEITKLTQKQMQSPNVVCPNGNFSNTNQTDKLPYDEWLRARITPRPPLCIPDPMGNSYCPI